MITTSVNDICNEYPAQDRYLIEKFNSLMRIRVKRLGWYRDNLVPCLGRDFVFYGYLLNKSTIRCFII